ncbi:MAG: phenylalanine--tRNA ligase subunit beta [Actinomycetaceae bacterium]|nr:phenylalanine--tRNA ligase subunit beta [Actinomycetaceae bacterium]
MPNVPISWLKDHVEVLPGTDAQTLAADLVKVGLEEETIHSAAVKGPLVVGRVLSVVPEKQKNGKTINYCRVDVGVHNDAPGEGKEPAEVASRGIICGAHNFKAGDLVPVILPGGVLPGDFEISARKTYGHISDGMICSERELGMSDEHAGIIVLTEMFDEADIPPVGESLIEFLGLGEELLEINVTPDRGYCFSMRGVAREYSHSTGTQFTDPGLPASLCHGIPEPTEAGFAVEVDDDNPIRGSVGCDRFVTRIVRGIDPNAPTPKWMIKRLEAMGMRSISLAVDITNYVMLDLGQPLHAYDLDAIAAPIVVRRARSGESLVTLDEQTHELDAEDLLITDCPQGQRAGRILGLAGVMGGQYGEVETDTTNVLIEAAHFDPITVARTARRHRIPSEAAKRFERGVDPLLPPVAAQRVVDLLVEYGGGTADEAVFDLNNLASREPIEMSTSEPRRVAGVDYGTDRIIEILTMIGCDIRVDGETLLVTAPSWRPDLTQPCDLVEEIARLDGYDNIESVLPVAPAGQGLPPRMKARRAIAQTLADIGFVEVGSYPFIGDAHDRCQIPEDDERRNAVKLRNPLVDSQPLLRTSILDSLLETAQRNAARGAESIRVFELGMVTRPAGTVPSAIPSAEQRPHPKEIGALHRGTPKQPWHLGLVAGGQSPATGVRFGKRDYDWADVIDAGQRVGIALGLTIEASALYRDPDITMPPGRPLPQPVTSPESAAPWHPGRSAILFIRSGKKIVEIGRAGELHPRVVENYGLPGRSVALELDLDALIKVAPVNPIQVSPVSTYPPVKEDIALVLDQDIPIGVVIDTIRSAGGHLLEEVTLFDEYSGSQIEDGKRSLAFALRMRAADHTMSSEEAAQVRNAIITRVSKTLGAKLRA